MLQDKSIKIKTKTKDCVLIKIFLEIVWNLINTLYFYISNNNNNNQNPKAMKTETKNFTGEYIKFENGNVMSVYSQFTKNGMRYYRYFRGRFQVISRTEIEMRIYENN
jgi:hypothetical protein